MLGKALTREWMPGVIFVEAGRTWMQGVRGEGLFPLVQGIGVVFKQPVIILHVSFRAISTCQVCPERPHEEQANSAAKSKSPMWLFVR